MTLPSQSDVVHVAAAPAVGETSGTATGSGVVGMSGVAAGSAIGSGSGVDAGSGAVVMFVLTSMVSSGCGCVR
jgi:hypothetical protein